MQTKHAYKKPANSATYKDAIIDPAASVFVSANAGSGKTSLLSRRVLSLLLGGAAPSKILCLTFTKAAAAEMGQRILAELGAWVMADEKTLREALSTLLEMPPDETILARARSLFATVLDAPESLRIQTIHSFCQSLLARFPVEAGISPHFAVADDRSGQEMLNEARLRLLSSQHADAAVQELARLLSASDFDELLLDIVKNKRRFQSLFSQPGGREAATSQLYRCLNVSDTATPELLIEHYFNYDPAVFVSLRRIAEQLLQGEENNQELGQGIANWLEIISQYRHSREPRSGELGILTDLSHDVRDKIPAFAGMTDYVSLFLTDKYEKRKRLFTGKILDLVSAEQLLAEQERVAQFHDACRSLEIARLSAHVLRVAEALLKEYVALKETHARMDYDDLVLAARSLLQQPDISPWVLFKLDGGIDHVLVDEAQDTSPEQWEIISALTDDFFAGKSKSEGDRSLFIVGDEKQSIFSFQGADVKKLAEMHSYFRDRIEASARPVHAVALERSFRSVPEVLKAVDAVFAAPDARRGVLSGEAPLVHIAHRVGHAGLVELWPLLLPQEGQRYSTQSQLVRKIASQIRNWLDEGRWQAGDIMILLRTRTTLMERLVRALKRQNIPVAGADRMMLGENLAVQDLVALGQILLLPEDDLTLAALLKSPVGNLSEEELFTLCWQRGEKSLWQRLQDTRGEVYGLLADLRAKADFMPPYELYAYALDTLGLRKRFLGRMGGEYADAIDEFLSQALAYQRDHAPSLQGFLHWLASSESEIKRDMEQSKDCVRVMTVHAAKGLQAPVVILPDTVTTPVFSDWVLWQDGLSLWVPSQKKDNIITRALRERYSESMLEEYRRLLYVAMTRAEDALYICGATGEKKANEKCWYSLIERGLLPLAEKCETPVGEGWRIGKHCHPERAVGESKDLRSLGFARDDNFTFLTQPPPSESAPPRPLAPSRMEDQTPAASPLKSQIYARGLFIHLLLQHLPEIKQGIRRKVAEALAGSYRQQMAESEIVAAIGEAIGLIENPKFAAIFPSPLEGEGRVGGDCLEINTELYGATPPPTPSLKGRGIILAEAPITGTVTVGGKPFVVSGQIDRLCITEKEIWVVDYKTNREPPDTIPAAYLRQMALYRLLLKEIYPNHAIRCALLWTIVPRMDILDEAALATYL